MRKFISGSKLNELFSAHRQLQLEICRFKILKQEFDQLKADFHHIKHNQNPDIDPAECKRIILAVENSKNIALCLIMERNELDLS